MGTEEKIYRNVHPGNYSSYVAGFYANKDFYKWGTLIRIRGKQRELVHKFGDATE